MPNSPGDRFNRKGCLLILAILALFIILYMLVGLSAAPQNRVTTKIQPAPANQP